MKTPMLCPYRDNRLLTHMPYNPDIHHRRSVRFKGYDYSQPGAYFVTICTYQRICLFGEIVNGEMKLNLEGQIVTACWQSIPRHFLNIELDEFVVMPNHLHGIVSINNDLDEGQSVQQVEGKALANQYCHQLQPYSHQCFAPTEIGKEAIRSSTPMPKGTKPQSLAATIQNFKSVSTRQINRINQSKASPVWQSNYYEHIIRDRESLNNIRHYIVANPLNWLRDQENPINFNVERSPN